LRKFFRRHSCLDPRIRASINMLRILPRPKN
jgi:hypothetical protein